MNSISDRTNDSYFCKNNTIAFTSIERTVHKKFLPKSKRFIKHKNTSYFYRDDLNWHMLREYLVNKYKETDKVNLYCYACSDGSEPYTIAMELDSFLGETGKKFFPIIAKDYDSYIINRAKSGYIDLDCFEAERIQNNINLSLNKYLKKSDKKIPQFENPYTVSPILSSLVKFDIANIKEDVKNIEPNNSIIFIRNVWPYINNGKNLAEKLCRHMGKNCTIVIGNFDWLTPVYDWFKKMGFRDLGKNLNIFEK